MGLAVGMDIGDTLGTVVTIDTGMGSVTFSADAKGDQLLIKLMGLLLATDCSGVQVITRHTMMVTKYLETQSDIHLRQLMALQSKLQWV